MRWTISRSENPLHREWIPVCLAALGLLICTSGPSTYLALHVVLNSPQHPWIFLYPLAAVAIAGTNGISRRLRGMRPNRFPAPLYAVALYCGWAVASAFWSVSGQTTAVQSLVGLGVAMFGCWFGWCLSTEQQINSIFIASAVAVVSSGVTVVFLPQYGKMYPTLFPDDEWQGIFGNRNSLSPVCVLALLASVGFVAIGRSRLRIVLSIPVIVTAVILLRGSSGATSLAALTAAIAVAALVPLVQLAKRLGMKAWMVGGAGGVLATTAAWVTLHHMERLAQIVGRDSTLSGRRPIWQDVRTFIRVHPLRGYGFWAFWDRSDLTAATYARQGAAYGSAHNSILEVLLGLGYVGLVFYLAILLFAIFGVCRLIWQRPSVGVWWWAMVLAFLIVQNMMESFVLWHSYNWVLTIAVCLVPFQSRVVSGGDSDGEVCAADLPVADLVGVEKENPVVDVGSVRSYSRSIRPRRVLMRILEILRLSSLVPMSSTPLAGR